MLVKYIIIPIHYFWSIKYVLLFSSFSFSEPVFVHWHEVKLWAMQWNKANWYDMFINTERGSRGVVFIFLWTGRWVGGRLLCRLWEIEFTRAGTGGVLGERRSPATVLCVAGADNGPRCSRMRVYLLSRRAGGGREGARQACWPGWKGNSNLQLHLNPLHKFMINKPFSLFSLSFSVSLTLCVCVCACCN